MKEKYNTKIIHVKEQNTSAFERTMNEKLEGIDLIDIKYSSNKYYYSAIIIYRVKDEGE